MAYSSCYKADLFVPLFYIIICDLSSYVVLRNYKLIVRNGTPLLWHNSQLSVDITLDFVLQCVYLLKINCLFLWLKMSYVNIFVYSTVEKKRKIAWFVFSIFSLQRLLLFFVLCWAGRLVLPPHTLAGAFFSPYVNHTCRLPTYTFESTIVPPSNNNTFAAQNATITTIDIFSQEWVNWLSSLSYRTDTFTSISSVSRRA